MVARATPQVLLLQLPLLITRIRRATSRTRATSVIMKTAEMRSSATIVDPLLTNAVTPQKSGMTKAPVSDEVIKAHHEQVARRALHKFMKQKQAPTISKDLLPPKSKIYFSVKDKDRSWHKGYVQRAEDHIVHVCKNENLSSRAAQVAYEDIRLVPESLLLHELDCFEQGAEFEPLKSEKEMD